MLPVRQLARVLGKVQLITSHGPWSRAVAFQNMLSPPPGVTGSPQPLWGGASRLAGGRFTPRGGFDSIYLAGDPVTAFIEVSALILLPGGPVPVRSAPWVVVSVAGWLDQWLDLTAAATLAALGSNEQEVTGTWVKLAHPPTQVLGQAPYDSGRITGLKYRSARHPGGINLAVFPDRLARAKNRFLEVYDPPGKLSQRLSG